MCTNKEVAQAWANNQVASNHRGSLRTTGLDLFSYDLCIGKTTRAGRKVVFFARAPHNYYSQTTSSHVGYAMRVADQTVTERSVFEGIE